MAVTCPVSGMSWMLRQSMIPAAIPRAVIDGLRREEAPDVSRNAWVRRLLVGFGAEVVPVLSNEEAVSEATARAFDVAVSDIDRGGAETGAQLGIRLKAAGLD